MAKVLLYSWKIIRSLVLTIGLVLLLLLWALRSPWIQNQVIPYAEDYLGGLLKTEVSIGEVDFALPARAVFREVEVADQRGARMFAIRELRVGLASYSLWRLITQPGKGIRLKMGQVDLIGPEAHLYRSRADSAFNFAFLTESEDTTESQPLKLDLLFPKIRLRNGRLFYTDSTRHDSVLALNQGVNYANLNVEHIRGDFDFHLHPGQEMDGHIRDFSADESRSGQSISHLSTGFLFNPGSSEDGDLSLCLDNARLDAGHTRLDFDAQFSNKNALLGLPGFSPNYSVFFRHSAIDFGTLNALLPTQLPLKDSVLVDGFLWGDQESVVSDSVFIGIYEHTRLVTSLNLTGLDSIPGLTYDLDIREGQLSFEELERFLAVEDLPLAGLISPRGRVIGDLHAIRSQNLVLDYGKASHLQLKARIDDYTDPANMMMDIRFRDSYLNFGELRDLLPSMELPGWFANAGTSRINGKFFGGIADFVVDAEMQTEVGAISSNLHLLLPPKTRSIGYDGYVKTERLNLRALIPDGFDSRYLNFEGNIKGEGMSFGEMVATVNGKATDSDVMGYHLDLVEARDVKIDQYKIVGTVDLTDPEGSASVKVNLDLQDSTQSYKVFGDVQHVDLAHYGVYPDDSLQLSSVLNIKVSGDSLENYTGKLRFFLLDLRRKDGDSVQVSDAVLAVDLSDQGIRDIELKSSLADMHMTGSFSYKKIGSLFDRLSQETRLYIQNNDSLIQDYYANKFLEPEEIELSDTLWTKAELNDLIRLLGIPVYVEPATQLRVHLHHDLFDDVKVNLVSDSLTYDNIALAHDSLELILTKDGSQNFLIGTGFVGMDRLRIGESLVIHDLSFEPTADDREIDYFLRAHQPEIGNAYILNARTIFENDGTIRTFVRSQDSEINLKGRSWRFAQGNAIERRFEQAPSIPGMVESIIPRYHIENLRLYHDNQVISVDGIVSTDIQDKLDVRVRNLRVESLLEILESPEDMSGLVKNVDAKLWLLLSDQPAATLSGEVEDFQYKEIDSIGVRFGAGWPFIYGPDYAGLRVAAGHWGKDSLVVKGWYNMSDGRLNMNADSSTILLEWAEPFLEGVLSDMQGVVTVDELNVSGTISKPILEGEAHFTDTRFKVDYLNNVFILGDNKLLFDNEKITIPQIRVQDTLGQTAQLGGRILYNDSAGVKLDIKMDEIDNFTFMDTRLRHNPDFYGKVILAGDSARITGLATSPVISAWVTTAPGSWLDIPLTDYSSATRLDFVNFIHEQDSMAFKSEGASFPFAMNLVVNATEDARARLIFDEQVGDIIEAWGDGTITLAISSEGDFTMFGSYVISKGNYMFTAENIVNKKFLVDKGGTITWGGDPYDAQMDLSAVYEVKADISDLVGDQGSGNRVPVDILMHLKGSLAAPNISLELRLDQVSEQDVLGLASYFRGIQYDQQELNKQVVSLLMFRRFTHNSSYFSNSGSAAGVTSSLSELISNQVNYWISQAFNDANVGVEVSTNEFQDVELALSATLFNDKVTVERNGTIIGGNSQSFSIGDLSVQIKLLPIIDSSRQVTPGAGQLVMEIFNREDASMGTVNNVSRGLGVFYKKDFDRLSDLLDNRSKMRKEEPPMLESEVD